MKRINLNFRIDDLNLDLNGSAMYSKNVNYNEISIVGMAEWRHLSANTVCFSQGAIEKFDIVKKSNLLNKAGINWIGVKGSIDIGLSYSIRKRGKEKIKKMLEKILRIIGAKNIRWVYLHEVSPDIANKG